MAYPPFLHLPDEAAYRAHFESTYCRGPISTFDGLNVRFQKRDFEHCCFESTNRDRIKNAFSQPRAQRMDWIRAALQDPGSERFVGWDRDRKKYDRTRRVTLVMGDYVVVILLTKPGEARFITAYVADTRASLLKIRSSPIWA